MRLRRKPWARPELDACPFYVPDPPSLLGRWRAQFANGSPLYIELGCGKGGFIAREAARHPERAYLAIDLKSEVLALAKRHIDAAHADLGCAPDNIKIMSWDIERIDLMLGKDDAADALYVNFPNPWPKNRHKKKRLTHTRQLLKYRAFLVDGGHILFKTDDDELFEDSLIYFEEAGYTVERAESDLYENGVPDGAALTEHEQMFLDKGLPIHFIRARKSDLPALDGPNI